MIIIIVENSCAAKYMFSWFFDEFKTTAFYLSLLSILINLMYPCRVKVLITLQKCIELN